MIRGIGLMGGSQARPPGRQAVEGQEQGDRSSSISQHTSTINHSPHPLA
jgi:hypothetical protein